MDIIYKCNSCGYSTGNDLELIPIKSCCGRKKYKCPKCGRGYVLIYRNNHSSPKAETPRQKFYRNKLNVFKRR